MTYKSERDNEPKAEHVKKLELYLKKIDELRTNKREDRDSV